MQFTSLTVQPSYGARSAVIRWTVDNDLQGSTFYVYRSPDGVSGWTLLDDTGTDELFYSDTGLIPANLSDVTHYRVLAVLGATEVDSPVVGIYSTLSRKEYAVCAKIMKMEFIQLTRADGIQLLLYKPLRDGVPSLQVDPDTMQHTGVPCPNTPHEENSYDQLYNGGYNRPITTVARFTDTGPLVVMDRENGMVARDTNMVQARFLGFPHIASGDMLVDPVSDDRYAVTDTVKAYKFKGIVPVAFDAKLQLLHRSDVRYKVPVPTTVPLIAPTRY